MNRRTNQNHHHVAERVFRSEPRFISYFKQTIIPTLIYGLIIGIFVGIFVFGFNKLAEFILEKTETVYQFVANDKRYIPVLLIGLALLGSLSYLFAKLYPKIMGSGIPYTEGVMEGKLEYDPARMGIGMFSSSVISVAGGLPLDVEGPSIALGGVIGATVNKIGQKLFKKGHEYERLSVTSGAAAGFAIAFNAPLTGIAFSLEEGHKKLSAPIILSSGITIVFAVFTSSVLEFWTTQHIRPFYFPGFQAAMNAIDFQYIWMIVILGIVIGLLASLFCLASKYIAKGYDKSKLPLSVKIISVFIIMGLIGIFIPEVIGSGHTLVEEIALKHTAIPEIFNGGAEGIHYRTGVEMIFLFFVVKFLLISVFSNSGVTGGISFPTLCLGALCGALMGELFIIWGLPEECYTTIVAISMCAFMGAVNRSPITAIILIVEVTGNITDSLVMMIVAIIFAYMTIEVLHIHPIYEEQLEEILEQKNHHKKRYFLEFSYLIEDGSFIAGREIRDILWPDGATIKEVYKIDKHGKFVTRNTKAGLKVLYPGNVIIVTADTYDPDKFDYEMKAICCGKDEVIEKSTIFKEQQKMFTTQDRY